MAYSKAIAPQHTQKIEQTRIKPNQKIAENNDAKKQQKSRAKSYSWAMPTKVNPMRIVMPRSKFVISISLYETIFLCNL